MSYTHFFGDSFADRVASSVAQHLAPNHHASLLPRAREKRRLMVRNTQTAMKSSKASAKPFSLSQRRLGRSNHPRALALGALRPVQRVVITGHPALIRQTRQPSSLAQRKSGLSPHCHLFAGKPQRRSSANHQPQRNQTPKHSTTPNQAQHKPKPHKTQTVVPALFRRCFAGSRLRLCRSARFDPGTAPRVGRQESNCWSTCVGACWGGVKGYGAVCFAVLRG